MTSLSDRLARLSPTQRRLLELRLARSAAEPAPAPRAGRPMRFGVFFFSLDEDRLDRDKYHLVMEAARYADEHGLSAVWTPERHFHPFGGLYPSPVAVAAAIATATSRISVRAGSVVLPLHHPVRVAEEWSVVDNLSDGRVGLSFASGWSPRDFVFAPDRYADRDDIMFDGIETVCGLWRGESRTLPGGAGDVEIRLRPRPVQPELPFWVTSAGNPATAARAGRSGANLLTAVLRQSVERAAANIAVYRDARSGAGLDPATGEVALMLHTYLGADEAEVRAAVRGPLTDYLSGYLDQVRELTGQLDLPVEPDRLTGEERAALVAHAVDRYLTTNGLFGTPESALSTVDRLAEAGVDEVACLLDFGLAPEEVLAGLRHLVRLRDLVEQRATPVAPASAPGAPQVLPLSSGQRRLWFLDRMLPANPAYHVRLAVRITGAVDVELFRRAIEVVRLRHEPLHTRLRTEAGVPVQVLDPAAGPLVRVEQVAPEDLDARIDAEVVAPFELEGGALWRVAVLAAGPREHVLVLTLHHVIADGVSAGVLEREITLLYAAWHADPAADPGRVLPPLRARYRDFVRRQEELAANGELDRQLAHWRRELAGAPARLTLPPDAAPARLTYAGARHRFRLDPAVADRVRAAASAADATVYMVLLTAFALTLGAHSGQRDVVVGSPIANRPGPEFEPLVGLFANTVALRTDLGGDPDLATLLTRVRQTCLAGYENQDAPFERVIDDLGLDRDPAHHPLFQASLVFQKAAGGTVKLPGLTLARHPVESHAAKFAIGIDVTDDGGELAGFWEYNTDLLAGEDIDGLHTDLLLVLTACADEPGRPVEEIRALLRARAGRRGRDRAARIRTTNRAKLVRRKAAPRAATSGEEHTTMSTSADSVPPAGPARGARARRTVRVHSDDLVRAQPWDSPSGQPLVVSPNVPGVDLTEWVSDHKDWFDRKLAEHAGILFRDFGVGVADFERFMTGVSGDLLADPARYDLPGPREKVYVSTQYPAALEIFMHNETWWQWRWPMKIFFCCQVRPDEGGATLMADCRRVLKHIDPAVLESFEPGLVQVRNFGPGLGLRRWQDVFGTEERSVVEKFCDGYHMRWEWRDGDHLHVRNLRPVLIDHPVTGERLWFNHAAHGHMTTNTTPDMAKAVADLGIYDVPMNTYYADGSPIPPEVMASIRDAYRRETVVYPWEPGNVLVLDNMLASHGRAPFTGRRKVLVGMSEPTGWPAGTEGDR